MVLVSFRINTGNFLLDMEGRPSWLLACHERWNLSLGTLICRQLGYLHEVMCLPLYHQDFPHGTHCWISGWGYTTPEHVPVVEMLKEAIVPLISTKKCNSSCVYFGELTPRMLCAGYLDGKVDTCQVRAGREQPLLLIGREGSSPSLH
nr:transmembrane protease serine 5-like [Chelonoidis abingdonii]